ncbi:MAG: hypothetical protein WC763_01730 [Candidatus Paceibacterota bacterium]|jgi:hypothetical protein
MIYAKTIRAFVRTSPVLVLILSALALSGIALAATSYQVTKTGGNLTVNEFSVCKKVINNNSKDIFVPTKTSNEWSLFRNNAPNVVLAPCGPIATILWVNGQSAPAGSVAAGGGGVTILVPLGATTMTVQLKGGKGGDNGGASVGYGGNGGMSTATFNVTAGNQILMKFISGGTTVTTLAQRIGGGGSHVSNLSVANVWATVGGGGAATTVATFGGSGGGIGIAGANGGSTVSDKGFGGHDGVGGIRKSTAYNGNNGGGYGGGGGTGGAGGTLYFPGLGNMPNGAGGGGGYGGGASGNVAAITGSASASGGGGGGGGGAGYTGLTQTATDLTSYTTGAIELIFN